MKKLSFKETNQFTKSQIRSKFQSNISRNVLKDTCIRSKSGCLLKT